MQSSEQFTNSTDNPKDMEVQVFPVAEGEFTLWEDEGDTAEDLDENWVATKMEVSPKEFVIHAAEGNRSVLPEKRSWKLVFAATKECTPKVCVEGERIEIKTYYDEVVNSLIVEVPEIDVTKQIIVCFTDDIQIEGVSAEQRIFFILEKAQMDYDLKQKIYKTFLETPEAFEEYICKEDMDENVRECILSQVRV